jgi:hypothetical protein
MIRTIERKLGKSIERRTLEGFDYKQAPQGAPQGHKPHPHPHPHADHSKPRPPGAPGKSGRPFWRKRRRPR